MQVPEQQSVPVLHGAPGKLQQPHGLVAFGWHFCTALGQNCWLHAVPDSAQGVSHMHWPVLEMKTQASCGGQSPAHIGGWPAAAVLRHGMVVVVVVGTQGGLAHIVVVVVLVVVVLVGRTTAFSTGVHRSCGRPTTTSSVWNWSVSVTSKTFFGNFPGVAQSFTVVGERHCVGLTL